MNALHVIKYYTTEKIIPNQKKNKVWVQINYIRE